MSEQWRDVMFSDEASVNSSSVTVRRSKAMDRYADKYVVKTVKHSPSVRVADPDPHSFELLDPDPHSNCGSGSRRAKMTHKNRKKYRIFVF
jgi:hypothetical protein